MPAENIKLLENFISYCSAKNRVLNKNIANVGTKDYKREDVQFKDMLNENLSPNLKVTEQKHISGLSMGDQGADYELVKDDSTDMASGVNNVDIDNEMAELADNSIKFKFAAKKIGNYYKDLQNAIKSGGRL